MVRRCEIGRNGVVWWRKLNSYWGRIASKEQQIKNTDNDDI